MSCLIRSQYIYSPYAVYVIATLFSILISLWLNSTESLLNPDAICYLQSAAIMSQGLHTAMALCDQSQWPFYSLLIAGFVWITHVSYEHAAFILNGLFSLGTVLIFVRIVQCLTDKKRIHSLD